VTSGTTETIRQNNFSEVPELSELSELPVINNNKKPKQ